MPFPSASVADQLLHVILDRNEVESPDSAQPKPPHAGMNSNLPWMSWPWARKVLAAASRTAVLCVIVGCGAPVTTTFGLPKGLQAVTIKAAQAIPAKPATCRALRTFAINMDVQPLNSQYSNWSAIRRPSGRHGWTEGDKGE